VSIYLPTFSEPATPPPPPSSRSRGFEVPASFAPATPASRPNSRQHSTPRAAPVCRHGPPAPRTLHPRLHGAPFPRTPPPLCWTAFRRFSACAAVTATATMPFQIRPTNPSPPPSPLSRQQWPTTPAPPHAASSPIYQSLTPPCPFSFDAHKLAIASISPPRQRSAHRHLLLTNRNPYHNSPSLAPSMTGSSQVG